MNKYRKLRKLAELDGAGPKHIFWEGADGTIAVGYQRLSMEEFDDYVKREFPPNATVYICRFATSEEILEDGRGQITVGQEERKYVRR